MAPQGLIGPDLLTYLREQGPLPPQQAALFAAALADQLAALHAAGLVHGALVPEVVRVEVGGECPRPLMLDRQQSQRAGGPAPADDVYAAGILLAELLGIDPGSDEGLSQGPPAPEGLWTLIGECLAADPTSRPATAPLARRLREIARDLLLGIATRPSTAATGIHTEPADASSSIVDRTALRTDAVLPGYVPGPPTTTQPLQPARWRRPGITLIVSSATVAVVLAAVGIVFTAAWHGPSKTSRRPSAQAAVTTSTAAGSTPAPPTRPAPPAEPTADTGSVRPTPTGPPYLVRGSEISLNAGSGHGCKAWLNGRNPGPYAQGVIESSGDDCEMALWRSKDGGHKFYIVSGTHRIRSGKDETGFYWDGDVYLARVCLHDYTTGQGACGNGYGGQAMTAAS